MNGKRLFKVLLPFIIAVGMGLTALLLTVCAHKINGFGEWYAENIYPVFVWVIGGINGFLPFSLFEFLIILCILGALAGIIVMIVFLIRKKGKRLAVLRNSAAVLFCFAGGVYLVYTLFCGINYTRVPFSEKSGLVTSKYTADEVGMLCTYLVDNVNTAAEQMKAEGYINGDGKISIDEGALPSLCSEAMNTLGESYTALSGNYPTAKAVICSEFMSHCRILGVYSPITIEANYNAASPIYARAFTICHELSHLKGFMREDEANYIAFLACKDSDSVILRYSGYVQALSYAMNAYYSAAGAEKYSEMYGKIHPLVQTEFYDNSQYWKQYETPVAKVSEKVNDTYLKSQGQSDGAKSYGRFVDLMIYQLLKDTDSYSGEKN